MDYGMKITKKGFNALTETDPRNFLFYPIYNTLKIYLEGFGTASVSTGSVFTLDVAHDLGYKPMVFLYFQHPETGHWYSAPCRTYDFFAQPPTWDLLANIKHTDVNNVQIRIYDGDPVMTSSPTNVNYKYYIFADPRENAWYEPAPSDSDNSTYVEDYGLKISREGIDVRTASPQNLAFDSSFPTLKHYKTVHFTTGGTVKHGLDYPPTFMAFREDTANPDQWIRGDVLPIITSGLSYVRVDDNDLYCTNTTEETYVILFIDPLNE